MRLCGGQERPLRGIGEKITDNGGVPREAWPKNASWLVDVMNETGRIVREGRAENRGRDLMAGHDMCRRITDPRGRTVGVPNDRDESSINTERTRKWLSGSVRSWGA